MMFSIAVKVTAKRSITVSGHHLSKICFRLQPSRASIFVIALRFLSSGEIDTRSTIKQVDKYEKSRVLKDSSYVLILLSGSAFWLLRMTMEMADLELDKYDKTVQSSC